MNESLHTRDQLYAFLAIVLAILILGMAPIVTAGFMGKTLPDSLIAVSDKTVTGLVGVLGSLATLIFRTNKADEIRADNTGKVLDAFKEAASNPPPTPDGPTPVEHMEVAANDVTVNKPPSTPAADDVSTNPPQPMM